LFNRFEVFVQHSSRITLEWDERTDVVFIGAGDVETKPTLIG